jgi:hypothetical protein
MMLWFSINSVCRHLARSQRPGVRPNIEELPSSPAVCFGEQPRHAIRNSDQFSKKQKRSKTSRLSVVRFEIIVGLDLRIR